MTKKYEEPKKHNYSINLSIDLMEQVNNMVGTGKHTSRSKWIEDAIQSKIERLVVDYDPAYLTESELNEQWEQHIALLRALDKKAIEHRMKAAYNQEG